MKAVLMSILCWSIAGQTTAEVLSKNIMDFLTYITGDLDNQAQIALKGNAYDLVQVRVRRVRVPSLEPGVVLFVEQATNGVIKFFQLGVVREGPAGTVTMKLYSFINVPSSKFGTYKLDHISQVKREQLQTDHECVASFDIVGKGLMTGTYPNCRYADNGKHPYLIITYTCDFDAVVFPNNTDQKFMISPYVFRHVPSPGESMKDGPEDYTNPCGFY